MRAPACLLLVLVLASCAGGETGPAEEPVRARDVVVVRSVSPDEAGAGETVELSVRLEIAEGFHIQANPASEPYLIPAVLELEATDGLEPAPPVYPPGTAYRIQGADEDLSTYAGSLAIRVPLTVDPEARPGGRTLRGSFRYQACDARHCLAPTTIAVESSIDVLPDR